MKKLEKVSFWSLMGGKFIICQHEVYGLQIAFNQRTLINILSPVTIFIWILFD